MAMSSGKVSLGEEEEEEDVEALRLAALRTLHSRKAAAPAFPGHVPGMFRVPPPPPPRRGHAMHPKRNLNGVPPKMGGLFRRHRINSNLISIVPISDEPSPAAIEAPPAPKLVLPQDRYCRTPDVETRSKTSVPTKFSRYDDSDSDSSAESDEESDNSRSRKRRRNELDSGGGIKEEPLDEKIMPTSEDTPTPDVEHLQTSKFPVAEEAYNKTVKHVCAAVGVTHEVKAVEEQEVSLELLMQQLNEAIGDGQSSVKVESAVTKQTPHLAPNTVLPTSPVTRVTPYIVKKQEPTPASIPRELNGDSRFVGSAPATIQGVNCFKSEKVPQVASSSGANVSLNTEGNMLPLENVVSHPRVYHSSPNLKLQFSGKPRSPQYCNPRSPNKEMSPRRARRVSQSPPREQSPPGARYSESKARRPMSPKFRQVSPKRSLSPVRRRSPSPQRFRSPTSESRRASSPRRSLSPRPAKSPRRYSPARQRSVSPHRYASPVRRHSRSPRKQRSVSPPRHCSRSPRRHHSPSPIRLRRSSSPNRRRSLSPRRRSQVSPQSPRRQLSPVRRPYSPPPRQPALVRRQRSSSLRGNSLSPCRLRSPSPLRQRFLSPRRQRSPSPSLRRLSPPRRLRSPLRRLGSHSPLHRLGSRSPLLLRRRSSRSPLRRLNSRSPSPRLQHPLFPAHNASPRRLRSPSPRRPSPRQRSPSPFRARSRSQSPCRDCARSPCRKHSSFPRKRSASPCRLHSPMSRKQQSPLPRRKQSPPSQKLVSSPPFRKHMKSPQRAQSPPLLKTSDFGMHQQPHPAILLSAAPSKLSPLLQRRNPSPPARAASPVSRSQSNKRWSSRSPSLSPGRRKAAFESRSPVGPKRFSPRRRVSRSPSQSTNDKISPVKEQVPEKSKSPFSRKCSTSPNAKTRNNSPHTKRTKRSRSPLRDRKRSKGQVRSRNRDDRQFKVQKPKSVEREKTSRKRSLSSNSKSSNHSSSLSLSPSPERSDVPTSPIRITNKYQAVNHRAAVNQGSFRNRVGTAKDSEKKTNRREREAVDLNKKLSKRRSSSRSPAKTGETNFDGKSHQPKHSSGSRRHRAPSAKARPVDVDPVVEARKRKFESACAIDPNKKKIRLKSRTEEKENVLEPAKEDSRKVSVWSPGEDVLQPGQETASPAKKVEKSDWDDIEEMDDRIQELEKKVNLWSSDESDFECRNTDVPKGAERHTPDTDDGSSTKKPDQAAPERSEDNASDTDRPEKRDRSKQKTEEARSGHRARRGQRPGSQDAPAPPSPDLDGRRTGSEQDLRAELSRRRAERLTKAGSVHKSLPARLVQSAFQSVVGSKALRKIEKEDEERRKKLEALKAERAEKPRRVTLLKKTDVEEDVSYFNITFSKGSKHAQRSPSPVKVPVQMRLGIPVAAGNSRRRRDKGLSASRKRSRRKSKRNAMLSGMEQV
ncbi:serine/arginine repetitive matrix protein 2-like isoform X2 [Bacillus rossius redtenbacheri]